MPYLASIKLNDFTVPAGELVGIEDGYIVDFKIHDDSGNIIDRGNLSNGFKFRDGDLPQDIKINKLLQDQLLNIWFFKIGWVVSKSVAELIDDYEPAVHQFVPVNVITKDESRISGQFYWLNVGTVLDAIDFEGSSVFPDRLNKKRLLIIDFKYNIKPGQPEKILVNKEKIIGHHLWTDKRLALSPHYYFLSDVLHDEIKEKCGSSLGFRFVQPS